jgi:hypothetical protein
MVPHSLNIAYSDGGSQVLWEDGEHAHSEAERGNGCGSGITRANRNASSLRALARRTADRAPSCKNLTRQLSLRAIRACRFRRAGGRFRRAAQRRFQFRGEIVCSYSSFR